MARLTLEWNWLGFPVMKNALCIRYRLCGPWTSEQLSVSFDTWGIIALRWSCLNNCRKDILIKCTEIKFKWYKVIIYPFICMVDEIVPLWIPKSVAIYSLMLPARRLVVAIHLSFCCNKGSINHSKLAIANHFHNPFNWQGLMSLELRGGYVLLNALHSYLMAKYLDHRGVH